MCTYGNNPLGISKICSMKEQPKEQTKSYERYRRPKYTSHKRDIMVTILHRVFFKICPGKKQEVLNTELAQSMYRYSPKANC